MDYILKPVQKDKLENAVKKALNMITEEKKLKVFEPVETEEMYRKVVKGCGESWMQISYMKSSRSSMQISEGRIH